MPIVRDAIWTPKAGAIVVVQSTPPSGGSAHWSVEILSDVEWVRGRDPYKFFMEGQVRQAAFATGIDGRLDNQKAAIDRLLDHLKQHCPQLMGKGTCDHLVRGSM